MSEKLHENEKVDHTAYPSLKHCAIWFALYLKMGQANRKHFILYTSLLYYWSETQFAPELYLKRTELMELCKISSTETYSAAIRDLDEMGWIKYTPGGNAQGKSLFVMVEWEDLERLLAKRNKRSNKEEGKQEDDYSIKAFLNKLESEAAAKKAKKDKEKKDKEKKDKEKKDKEKKDKEKKDKEKKDKEKKDKEKKDKEKKDKEKKDKEKKDKEKKDKEKKDKEKKDKEKKDKEKKDKEKIPLNPLDEQEEKENKTDKSNFLNQSDEQDYFEPL